MGVRRNGGQERTHGVDRMDIEGNSQERNTGNLEGGGVGVAARTGGLPRTEKIVVLDWG